MSWRFMNHTAWEQTGRARMRTGLFGRMVLQLQVQRVEYSPCPPMPGTDPVEWTARMQAKGEVQTTWVDARWEDLQGRSFTLGG